MPEEHRRKTLLLKWNVFFDYHIYIHRVTFYSEFLPTKNRAYCLILIEVMIVKSKRHSITIFFAVLFCLWHVLRSRSRHFRHAAVVRSRRLDSQRHDNLDDTHRQFDSGTGDSKRRKLALSPWLHNRSTRARSVRFFGENLVKMHIY